MKQRDDWHLTDTIQHEPGRGDPFAAAVRATRMPMVVTDPQQPDNPIVFCNEAFQKLSGYAREEIIGRNCRFLQGAKTDRAVIARIREAIEGGTDVDADLLNYRKDGSTFWNALYLSPVRNDAGEVQYSFASQLDVTDRVEAQATIAQQKVDVEREVDARTVDLTAALEAKTLLLHEVDHRVKNNLTMIGSLLRLQARSIPDPAVRKTLETVLERVDALATVHRRLYQSDDITKFDVGAFAANLVSDVVGASGRTDIRVQASVERIEVPSAKAAALGLVFNEVLTNAIKHAYAEGRSGLIRLSATRTGDRAEIVVMDDSPGMGQSNPLSGGLGQTLISRLSRQIEGAATWSSAEPGTRVSVAFTVGDQP